MKPPSRWMADRSTSDAFPPDMRYLELTHPTPAQNLACDEALLDWCEAEGHDEILRLWELDAYAVVLGYTNKIQQEVDLEACRELGISVLRRCSGGGTVLQGPGCMNYSLILRIPPDGPLSTLGGTNAHLMEQHRRVFSDLLGKEVTVQGHTDLTIGGRKFSGNAQRRKRHYLLFHGSLLLNFDLTVIERVLQMPEKQPDYRLHRRHSDFLTNLDVGKQDVYEALRLAWGATTTNPSDLPTQRIGRLAGEKYLSKDWTFKF